MQTVVIYDQLDADLRFFILEGDYRHLNDVYINRWIDKLKERKPYEKLQDELTKLVYKGDGTYETGYHNVELLKEFPTQAVLDGAVVIVAGFIP